MWGNTDVLELPLMGVEGQVSSATINLKKQSINFSGVGRDFAFKSGSHFRVTSGDSCNHLGRFNFA
jgi:hypothetical protein